MFQWEKNEEYEISSNMIQFNLSYTYHDRDSNSDRTVNLTPITGVPDIHFYYAISDRSITGFSNNMLSSFSSRYSSVFVPVRSMNSDEEIASRSVTFSDNTTSTIKLYEFVDVDTQQRPDFPSNINDCLDRDEGYGSSYDKHVTYSISAIPNGNDGYYLQLIINEGTIKEKQFTLARFNGAPFRAGITNYFGREDGGRVREFSDENDAAKSAFVQPAVFVFATATFAFQGYTTVRTIELTEITSSLGII